MKALFNISDDEFFNMYPSQCFAMIEYKNKYDNLLMLNLAQYNANLIMNEKADKEAEKLLKNIQGEDNTIDLERDVERYRMISERLNLKFPKKGGNMNGNS